MRFQKLQNYIKEFEPLVDYVRYTTVHYRTITNYANFENFIKKYQNDCGAEATAAFAELVDRFLSLHIDMRKTLFCAFLDKLGIYVTKKNLMK